jgi:hypothetical protein
MDTASAYVDVASFQQRFPAAVMAGTRVLQAPHLEGGRDGEGIWLVKLKEVMTPGERARRFPVAEEAEAELTHVAEEAAHDEPSSGPLGTVHEGVEGEPAHAAEAAAEATEECAEAAEAEAAEAGAKVEAEATQVEVSVLVWSIA